MAELVHPDRPLTRGFARVSARDGRTLTSADAARSARELTLHFGDGTIDAVTGEGKAPPQRLERPRSRPYVPPQPGLFDAPEE